MSVSAALGFESDVYVWDSAKQTAPTFVLGLGAAAACSLPGASAAPSPAFQALSGSVSAGNVLARSRAARCGDIRSTSFTWRVASMRSQPLRAVTTRA